MRLRTHLGRHWIEKWLRLELRLGLRPSKMSIESPPRRKKEGGSPSDSPDLLDDQGSGINSPGLISFLQPLPSSLLSQGSEKSEQPVVDFLPWGKAVRGVVQPFLPHDVYNKFAFRSGCNTLHPHTTSNLPRARNRTDKICK